MRTNPSQSAVEMAHRPFRISFGCFGAAVLAAPSAWASPAILAGPAILSEQIVVHDWLSPASWWAIGFVCAAALFLYARRQRHGRTEVDSLIQERTREVEETNQQLMAEIKVRHQVEHDLQKATDALESRVMERTSELAAANQKLREEMAERSLAEERIREQAALLDLAPDAIYVRELDARIRYWNKGAERLFGWTPEEARGMSFEQLYHVEEVPRLASLQSQLMQSGEWSGELRQTNKNGEELAVHSRWALIREKEGSPKSILVINTDLTERKKVEAQFQRARRLESIGTLTGGIAHDLNNALAPILIGVDLLRHQITDPASHHVFNQMEASVKKAAEVIKQMLTFSRGAEKDFAVVQARHVMENVSILIRETFPKNIQITSAISEDLWPVKGNASQLQQALVNLCDNARDAMPKGGSLILHATNLMIDAALARITPDAKPGPYVLLEVGDSGPGMTPEFLDKIFDPFFTTKGIGQGSGLGLCTALGLVKNHGGFILVDSKPGAGSRFRIHLPSLPEAIPTSPVEAAPAMPRGHGELVMVVEDDPLVRDITCETLERFGYKILKANDGTEALALFAQRRSQIQAVVTDLAMPMMDGPATIRALRRLDPSLKIITMSGAASNSKAAEAQSLGVTINLRKPFSTGPLLSALHDILRHDAIGQPTPKG